MNFKPNKRKIVLMIVISALIAFILDYFISSSGCFKISLALITGNAVGTDSLCNMFSINNMMASFIFFMIPFIIISYIIISLFEKNG
jgi:uncharacterized membrane-anchored protein YitT (DUF2179 family)